MMRDQAIKEEVAMFSFSELPEVWKGAWIELVGMRGFNPTLHPDWLRVVFTSWGIEAARVGVFIHHKGKRLLGVIPYIVEAKHTLGLPLKVMSLASNFVSYHAEIVCVQDSKASMRAFLANAPPWDKFYVQSVIEDGPTALAMREICAEEEWLAMETFVDISPYLPLEGTWLELLASKDKKFRYKQRKRNERLTTSNEMRLDWYDKPDQVDAFLRAFVEVEANSWKAQSGVQVSSSNREGRYYTQLLPFLAYNNALMANVLWLSNQPIAYSLCCRWGDWVGHLKTGFDARFEELSPGALVIDGCLEAAFEVGAREFDFLGTPGKKQPEPHKLHWTKQTRRHVSFEIFSNRLFSRTLGLMKQTRDRFAK